jgi:uncharacterized protein (TIGR02594 family)
MTTTLDIQRRLAELGYAPGPLDGIPGRLTIAAIRQFQRARGLAADGVVGPKTLAALFPPDDANSAPVSLPTPPWVTMARHKLGLNERTNNKTLRDWLASDGATLGDPAKLPWCGDFMETCIALTLPDEPMVANPYYALNWRSFGVPTALVALGTIAPFSRPGGGHIAMIVGHDQAYFHCLGGNQSNAVTITKIAKDRLAGSLRWPRTYALPTEALPMTSLIATVSTNEA